MRTAWGFIVGTLLIAACAVVGTGVFNARIDPLMQYRMPSYPPQFVTGFARHINAGLARHLDYDAVIVGSSYTMNFRNSDFDHEFGGKTISLAMPGMFASEGAKVAAYALQQRPVKRIYFGLDFFAFMEANNRYQFPDYLYDARWTNDSPYLLSVETLKRSIYIFLGHGPVNFNTSTDMPWSWASGTQFGRDRVLADFAKKRAEPPSTAHRYNLREMESVATRNLASLIASHSATEFEFFLPPYSALMWTLEADRGNLNDLLHFRLFLAKLLAQYPNAHLHDFQAWDALTCNLDRYSDIGHYSPEDNRVMVTLMRKRSYAVTPESTSANNARIETIASRRCWAPANGS